MMKKCQFPAIVVFLLLSFSSSSPADLLRSKVPYIRDKKAAPLEVPPLKGKYYNDLVPDTLDIAERAELAINALTAATDPEADYEIYYNTELFRNPPFMQHEWSDWCSSQWKYYEALSLLRLITGSDRNTHIDDIWLEIILRSIGPDGLFYIPLKGRPWSRMSHAWGPTVWRADGTTTDIEDESVEYIADALPIGRVMGILTNYYLRDNKNPAWRKLIERMVDRSLQLTIDKGDYGYMPAGFYEPNCVISPDAELPEGTAGLESYGRLIQAPANFYKFTGYEPARKLSHKLINSIRYYGNSFTADGGFCSKDQELYHFHAHTFALMSMIDYAAAAGDKELMDFVRKSFEWARLQGSPTVGYYPEYISPDWQGCETCEVADMIAIALKLSEAGAGDYWDDADRWVRNQFAENQLTKIDCIYEVVNNMPEKPIGLEDVFGEEISGNENLTDYKSIISRTVTDCRVLERYLGGFSRNAAVNSWYNGGGNKIEGCCVGNGSRTLYYIWKNILDYKNGQLKVNLLLNRASPWADVYSYIPYEGQVRLRIKKPCTEIKVRMPEWIPQNSSDVKCIINDKCSGFSWQGRYVDLGVGNPGDMIKVVFPISERTVKEKIANKDYTLVIRGNTVISIEPAGEKCPFYQRQYYRGNMSWRPVRRFVTECIIDY
jgi:hypothetical protein